MKISKGIGFTLVKFSDFEKKVVILVTLELAKVIKEINANSPVLVEKDHGLLFLPITVLDGIEYSERRINEIVTFATITNPPKILACKGVATNSIDGTQACYANDIESVVSSVR